MFKYLYKILTALLISLSSIVFSQDSTNGLNSIEPMMRGHFFALYMNQLFVNYSPVVDYNASILVKYNELDNMIEIKVLGKQTTIDRAKKSLDMFRNKLLRTSLTMLNQEFNLALSEDDIFITYINIRKREPLLVFKNGNYILE